MLVQMIVRLPRSLCVHLNSALLTFCQMFRVSQWCAYIMSQQFTTRVLVEILIII